MPSQFATILGAFAAGAIALATPAAAGPSVLSGTSPMSGAAEAVAQAQPAASPMAWIVSVAPTAAATHAVAATSTVTAPMATSGAKDAAFEAASAGLPIALIHTR